MVRMKIDVDVAAVVTQRRRVARGLIVEEEEGFPSLATSLNLKVILGISLIKLRLHKTLIWTMKRTTYWQLRKVEVATSNKITPLLYAISFMTKKKKKDTISFNSAVTGFLFTTISTAGLRSQLQRLNLHVFFQMALRGVWQLQKLIVSYCDWGGSSRGIRAFMESNLPAFKEGNPQLELVTELIRGQHPHLKAFYKNKNERVVCVKNMTPEDVLLHATRLRNALGRKAVKLKTRHVTKHPSVQGTWTTELQF